MNNIGVIIEWPDGTVDVGPTAEHVMELIASTQWEDYTPAQMRSVLSDRAWVRQQVAIDPNLPLHELFRQMEKAGMCCILRWEDGGKIG